MHMRGIRYKKKLKTLPSSSTVISTLQIKREIPQKVNKADRDYVVKRQEEIK